MTRLPLTHLGSHAHPKSLSAHSKSRSALFIMSALFIVSEMVLMSLIKPHVTYGETTAPPISYQRQASDGSVWLWRERGEALVTRHRVKTQLGGSGASAQSVIVETELTHLTSGCALALNWSLPPVSAEALKADQTSGQLDLSGALKAKRRVRSKRARKLVKGWGGLARKARGVSLELELPARAQLTEVTWWGCGRAASLRADPEQSKISNVTLPHGAVSTRARSPLKDPRAPHEYEPKLTAELSERTLALESTRWAFGLFLESERQVSRVMKSQADQSAPLEVYQWAERGDAPHKLTLHLIHAAPLLKPIPGGAPSFKSAPELKEWSTLLDVLSSSEGVTDGLGRLGVQRQWAGLGIISLIEAERFVELPAAWCEATLLGALRDLPAWPHPFRAYKVPLKPLDGRLLFPIALARYLREHPQGIKRAPQFLSVQWEGQRISGLVRKHLQDLISRGSFFANRPSRRHLIATHPAPHLKKPEEAMRYGHPESVALMPRALRAVEKLLDDAELRALISAPIRLELRAQKIKRSWDQHARGFFGRQVEVYEARNRIEKWGIYLRVEQYETAKLSLKYNLKVYEGQLNATPPTLNGWSGLDLLWGQHERDELQRLLNHGRQFPAGLLTEGGMVSANQLPFTTELTPQSRSLITPSAEVSALWILALNRQLNRRWPYKLKELLEDTRIEIWEQLTKPPETASSPWFNDHVSAVSSLLATLTAPPEVKAGTNIDVRELR